MTPRLFVFWYNYCIAVNESVFKYLTTELNFRAKNYLNLSDLKIKSVIRPQIPNNLYFLFCSLIIIFGGHFKSNFQLNINCSLYSNKLKHLNHFELTLIAAILISNDIFSRLKKNIFFISLIV